MEAGEVLADPAHERALQRPVERPGAEYVEEGVGRPSCSRACSRRPARSGRRSPRRRRPCAPSGGTVGSSPNAPAEVAHLRQARVERHRSRSGRAARSPTGRRDDADVGDDAATLREHGTPPSRGVSVDRALLGRDLGAARGGQVELARIASSAKLTPPSGWNIAGTAGAAAELREDPRDLVGVEIEVRDALRRERAAIGSTTEPVWRMPGGRRRCGRCVAAEARARARARAARGARPPARCARAGTSAKPKPSRPGRSDTPYRSSSVTAWPRSASTCAASAHAPRLRSQRPSSSPILTDRRLRDQDSRDDPS